MEQPRVLVRECVGLMRLPARGELMMMMIKRKLARSVPED